MSIIQTEKGIVRHSWQRTAKDLMAAKANALVSKSEAANLVMLLDCSGSMNEAFAETNRYYAMMQALPLLPQGRKVYFNNEVSERVLTATGGTDLTAAIQHIFYAKENRVLLISDGEPNDATSALAIAKSTGKQFDVLFIGSEAAGKQFMETLAAETGGKVITVNPQSGTNGGTKLLADAAKLLLLPPPK